MSGARPQLALDHANGAAPRSRGPLGHLLHALNQPLTGLQCSLELGLAGSRLPEQYLQTLREGLELTARMRILVEAVRELADLEQPSAEEVGALRLDALLHDATTDLLPVAESKSVRLRLETEHALVVQGDRRALAKLLFRLLESALSLTREGGDFCVATAPDQASFSVSWSSGVAPEHSPFSRPELGLLIAQAGWEQTGAKWIQAQEGSRQSCTVRFPQAHARAALQSCRMEELP